MSLLPARVFHANFEIDDQRQVIAGLAFWLACCGRMNALMNRQATAIEGLVERAERQVRRKRAEARRGARDLLEAVIGKRT